MSTTSRNQLNKDLFAEAAIRCFDKYGPQRTSMADIAEEAGASRQSIYRFFEDRSALVQYILERRITNMARSLKQEFSTYSTVDEALVEGSLASIRIARQDQLFNSIVVNSTDHSLELFLVRASEEIRDIMAANWAPLLQQARENGRIRDSITNEQIMEWIRHVHTVMMIRDDESEDAQRALLQSFFLPSVLRRPGP
ncbi:MAG: TetR/AcrR family transcriptional regulator [Henriciella sp.]|uniref:TetR/AcrR family transcriptional regulator n=1 Tax=Henriciella sp. TaxID=1968823 RepID=UPI0032EF2EAE